MALQIVSWEDKEERMNLAKGVEFDEVKHEYWYKGQQLSGVTGIIARKLGVRMSETFTEEHRLEGIHVHKAVQKWIETGDPESVHPGVKWLTETFACNSETGEPEHPTHSYQTAYSEVLVTDFKQYASAVDIIRERPDDSLMIYDIKKGSMNRQYVTYQLNIYRYFIERYAQRRVSSMVCISLRDREYYDIFPKSYDQVEKLLYG
jgi:hypothetical protein